MTWHSRLTQEFLQFMSIIFRILLYRGCSNKHDTRKANMASPAQAPPQDPEAEPKAAGRSSPDHQSMGPPSLADKTMSIAANLSQLLPTGTVLVYQVLSPSFTNHGWCFPANRYLALVLVYICTVSCVFFSFTDSFVGCDKKLYYGVATFKGFYVFNSAGLRKNGCGSHNETGRLHITLLDCIHAVLSAVVFLTVAFSDLNMQSCFFPNAGPNLKEILMNMPLAAGILLSIVILIFPTSRKGIGYSDMMPNTSIHICQ